MSKRMDALWRVAAFLWSFVAALVASVVVIVGMLWGAVDVLWQLVLGSDGLSSSSTPAMLVRGVIMWPARLQVYAFTGAGEMLWLPEW